MVILLCQGGGGGLVISDPDTRQLRHWKEHGRECCTYETCESVNRITIQQVVFDKLLRKNLFTVRPLPVYLNNYAKFLRCSLVFFVFVFYFLCFLDGTQ